MSVKGKKVGFIGAGNMGEALIRGLVESNLVPPDKILVADVRADRVHQLADQYGLRAVASNASLVSAVDVVILAVKPQIMAPVLREAMPALTNRPLLISIAAGVSTATIQSILGKYPRLIRVMPNTPALVLQGVTAIARAPGLEQDDLETAQEIFAAVGRAVVLDEEQMDAVTGLSGSAPPDVSITANFIEAIAGVVDYVLWAYIWIIIARPIVSWVSPDPFNPIVRFLHRATEPVLRPIRRRLPDMPIDFSPMIVIIAIIFLQRFLVKTLYQLAGSLG